MNTMEIPGTVAHVATIPPCDICPKDDPAPTPAVVDAKTFQGPWASMCDRHWRTWTAFPPATQDADPELGTGKGQRYSLEPAPSLAEVSDVRRAKAEHAASIGDFDSFMEAVGDGDPMDFL